MNARQVRQLLTPLYERIATTSPLDEFVLLAVFSEICEIRELARESGFDVGPIDEQLAKAAINEMSHDDYLANHERIHFYCPYLQIKPETFSQFKMTATMADDYLYLSMKNIDKVDSSSDLCDALFSADKFFLSGHHDHFIGCMSYICDSFDFSRAEVGDFFKRENNGSCASALSNSLIIVHNIIKDYPGFMVKQSGFWKSYTNFLFDYSKSLGVRISARAEDIDGALSSAGYISYGELADYLAIKPSLLEQSYNAFANTDIKNSNSVYQGINQYFSGISAVQLFIKLFMRGIENEYAVKAMCESFNARPSHFYSLSFPLIYKEDVDNNPQQFIALCKLFGFKDNSESAKQFAKILYNAKIDRQLIIQGVGSRNVLEYDLDL